MRSTGGCTRDWRGNSWPVSLRRLRGLPVLVAFFHIRPCHPAGWRRSLRVCHRPPGAEGVPQCVRHRDFRAGLTISLKILSPPGAIAKLRAQSRIRIPCSWSCFGSARLPAAMQPCRSGRRYRHPDGQSQRAEGWFPARPSDSHSPRPQAAASQSPRGCCWLRYGWPRCHWDGMSVQNVVSDWITSFISSTFPLRAASSSFPFAEPDRVRWSHSSLPPCEDKADQSDSYWL